MMLSRLLDVVVVLFFTITECNYFFRPESREGIVFLRTSFC